jgi:rod shape-determining protein MreC
LIFVFLIFLIAAAVIFFLAQRGLMQPVSGLFEQVTLPLQRFTFHTIHHESLTDDKLRKENLSLQTKLAEQDELEKENQALRDQFHTTNPPPSKLLPATIVGMTGFIPGESSVDEMIIDKGRSDGVKAGNVVVVKDNLIGRIVQTSEHLSIVHMVTHDGISFTAKTMHTSALGVIKGKGGGEVLLDNVVLSDKLEKNDLVMTKGDIDDKGLGYPPDLIVGKIVSVNKKASNLFQTAEVESLIDFSKLSMVFVVIN